MKIPDLKYPYYTKFIDKDSMGRWWAFDTPPQQIRNGWNYVGDKPDLIYF